MRYHRYAKSRIANIPPLPAPDAAGNYPAVEYARAAIARGIIRDRVAHAIGGDDRENRPGAEAGEITSIQSRLT